MPKPKTQAVQPSLYLMFLELMASRYALGLFIAGNLAPYILTISLSDLSDKNTYQPLNSISTPLLIIFALELLTARFAHDKNILDTVVVPMLVIIILAKEAVEKTIQPAFLLHGFFNKKVTEEKAALGITARKSHRG